MKVANSVLTFVKVGEYGRFREARAIHGGVLDRIQEFNQAGRFLAGGSVIQEPAFLPSQGSPVHGPRHDKLAGGGGRELAAITNRVRHQLPLRNHLWRSSV